MGKCAVKFCRSSSHGSIRTRSFFRFPTEQKRFNAWAMAMKRPDLIDADAKEWHNARYRICSEHFNYIDFSSMLMNRLTIDAVPSKFPLEAKNGPYFDADLCPNKNFSMSSTDPEETELPENKAPSEDDEEKEASTSAEAICNNIEVENAVEITENGAETSENDEEVKGNNCDVERTPNAESGNGNDEEDDFNPLLLCPDISMDIEESSVVTPNVESTSNGNNDFSDSNSLFTPLFSTFVDEMTGAEISFNLTAEEQQLREELYGHNNPVEFSKIHCTACNVHLGSALAGQTNRFVHPMLKVLICKECYHFYMSGEFEKDEDGSELYCRWCGQGGQVLCCSKCEFVFCKKCIRINFGRRKLTQVRDSDEWDCFRCDMSQIKTLRASCVEFFEYIREANARATVMDDPDFINRDLTTCCIPQAKKRVNDTDAEVEREVRKSKKRKNEEDPDYDPFNEEVTPQIQVNKPISPQPSTSGLVKKVNLPPLLPKPKIIESAPSKTQHTPIKTPTSTIRIGNAILNVNLKPTSISGKKEFVLATNPPQILRPILAQRGVIQIPNPRAPTRQVITPITLNRLNTPKNEQQQVRPKERTSLKHDWFEKTVRAAARVNSNLSYTLTQLNKAQSNATSVEQLAIVHNKLQEVLSGSINSLIQIRKNLRTEFIAGIKTVRFPPKQPKNNMDDDVIIVNTPQKSSTNMPQILKKPNPPSASPKRWVKNGEPTKATPPRGYLKVRSFSQLQSVTSECITIPDDDPPPAPQISEEKSTESEIVKDSNPENPQTDDDGIERHEDELNENEPDKTVSTENVRVKEEKEQEEQPITTYNVKENLSPKIRRMLSVKVNLKKFPVIEEKIKQEPIENGDKGNEH